MLDITRNQKLAGNVKLVRTTRLTRVRDMVLTSS